MTAIAVESADPVRSAERAERLLAPVLSRDRGPGEADLSAIAAPDGTSVFFCRTDAADGQLGRRLPHPGPPGRAAAELTGIDHVALSQPFDYFDEAALFYRSVLGLELQDGRGAGRARRAGPQARGAQRRRQRALRAQRPGGRHGGRRAPARRVRLRRRLRHRAGDAERGVPLLADPRQLLRRPRGPHRPRRRTRSSRCGRSASSTTRGERRRAPALLHRDRGRACSSRCSSAAAATTATAPRTRPCGSPPCGSGSPATATSTTG